MGWVNKLQAPEGLVLEELKLEILWCVHCTSSHILVLRGRTLEMVKVTGMLAVSVSQVADRQVPIAFA